MFPTLSVLLLAYFPFVVHGQSATEKLDEGPTIYNNSWFGGLNYFGGRGQGPFNVPLSQWNASLDDPDMTGTVKIPVPDLTKPFTENAVRISRLNALPQRNEHGSGWEWSIDLADDIPITIPRDYRDGDNDPRTGEQSTTTGVRLRLHAPEATTQDMDDSWQVCVIQWHLKEGTNATTFLRNHDSHECFLTPECIRDMQNYAASGPDGFGRCQCPDPKAIPSCKDADFPEWAVCSLKPWKAPDIRKWENGTLDVMNYAGRPHDENDNGFGYNATALIAWPVMVVWALEGDAPPDNSSSSSATTLRSLTSATATATRVGTVTTTPTFTLSGDEPVSTSVSTDTVTSTVISSNAASAPSGSGTVGKRQDWANSDGPRYAAAKLSCLSPRDAVEGKPEAGLPIVEKNAASSNSASWTTFALVMTVLAMI